MFSLVLPVVRTWNQLNTCSFPVVPLALFGRQLAYLASLRLGNLDGKKSQVIQTICTV
ncbi:hypothetical protein L195_g030976 [Trifolium pratense]|uniref:Uncharacterized protein n=1 Tax=Trifolium pratense TaxID=57577 RepID=A0A2K3L928_TRIPR|nr:hypothetical protein L195_g030976 [Trifolium pratense]